MKKVELSPVKQGEFLGVACDFYQDQDGNVYMTREQIGAALGYKNPQKAVDNIHARNKERLDRFSVPLKLRATDGKEYTTIVYVEKGIYEICRLSRQKVAHEFYDWVYEQISTLRKTGGVVVDKDLFIATYCAGLDEGMKALIKGFMAKVEEQQEKIKEMEPIVESWETFVDAKGYITISSAAKSLNIKGIGRNKLFSILRAKKILRKNNEPYQRYVNEGIFVVKNVAKNGVKYTQTMLTGKGLDWLRRKMAEWGYNV